jgi:hypothetical protein
MKPSTHNRLLRSLAIPLLGVASLGGLSSLTPAWAGIFPGLEQEKCMADAFGGSLNCTAKDIEVSQVVPVDPNQECVNGQVFTFYANVTVKTNASVRYDTTFYLPRTTKSPMELQGGAPNCSLLLPKASDAGENGQVAYVNLEPKVNATDFLDTCGDITKANGTDSYTLMNQPVTMLCQPSPTDPNKALFTYCAAWDQSKTLSCSADTNPPGAVPGTKSKCNCDSFAINVLIRPEPAKIEKTVTPLTRSEPGGVFTYGLSFKNASAATLFIGSLKDVIDVGGDGTYDKSVDLWSTPVSVGTADGIYLLSTTCQKPAAGSTTVGVLPGDTYSCNFTLHIKDRDLPDLPNLSPTRQYVDNIVALFQDKNGGKVGDGSTCPADFKAAGNNCSAAKTIEITNVHPDIAVEKTASVNEVLEPGDNVTYTVKVYNTSTALEDADNPLTLTSLSDDKFGDLSNLSAPDTCALGSGVTLTKDTPYECTFTRKVAGNAGDVHTNEVTAKAHDNENDEATGKDSATVNINDVDSNITLLKVADPISVPETGDTNQTRTVKFTFTFAVDAAGVDDVTFSTLNDVVGGVDTTDLTSLCSVDKKDEATITPVALEDGFVLSPGHSASCSIPLELQGNAGDTHDDTATITGKDEDGKTLYASDSATVAFTDELPTMDKGFALKATVFLKVKNTSIETIHLTSLKVLGVPVEDGYTFAPSGFVIRNEGGDFGSSFSPTACLEPPYSLVVPYSKALAPNEEYSCAFSVEFSQYFTPSQFNTFTSSITSNDAVKVEFADDEDNPVSGVASVTITTP